MVKNCLQCNKEFYKKINTSKKEWLTYKFCSKECGYLSRNIGKKIFNCKMCKTDFTGIYKEALYCSKTCKNKEWRGGSFEVSCYECNKLFTAKRSTINNSMRIFCSNICKNKCKDLFQRGSNHWNWRGGITDYNKLIRHSNIYNEWRKAVYKRDNWTCQICYTKQEHPIAHHIKEFSMYPELRFELGNGKTLCRSCHRYVHSELLYTTRFNKKITTNV